MDRGIAERIRGAATGLPLAMALVGAAAARLWRLDSLPPGLHVDEAFNILDARAVMAGWRPLFLPANAGREVLYTYWQALLFSVAGESITAARLASALAGIATIVTLWAFVRQLPLARPARVAGLSATLLGFSYWHLHFSRFGIRAAALPLVAIGAMWAWWRLAEAAAPEAGGETGAGLRSARWPGVALAILLAVAVYAHPVGRVLWVVPLADAVRRSRRQRDRRPLAAALGALAGAVALALPLLAVWLAQPWLLLGHAAETSILPGGPTAVVRNALRVAGMFNVVGDPAPWRNLAGRPVFDPLMGAVFLAGLVVAVRAARRGAGWAALALIWLVLLLLPTVATDAAPNFSRAIGVLPVVVVFPAFALDEAASLVARRWGRLAAAAVVAVIVILSSASAMRDYFVVWPATADAALAFDDDKAALAGVVNREAARGVQTYLSPAMAEHPTVQVLARGPTRGFDPADGLVIPEPTGAASYAYLPSETATVRAMARRIGGDEQSTPTARPHGARLAGIGGAAHEVLVFDAAAVQQWSHRLHLSGPGTVFDGCLRLAGAALGGPLLAGSTVTVTLAWDTLSSTTHQLNTTLRLVTGDGAVVAQSDGPPVGNTYPTDVWHPGERVYSDHGLIVPAAAPRTRAELQVGLYDWRTGRPVVTADWRDLVTVAEAWIE